MSQDKLVLSFGQETNTSNPKIVFDQNKSWELQNVGDIKQESLQMPVEVQTGNDAELDQMIQKLESQLKERDEQIEELSVVEMQMETQINLLKLILVEPLKRLHMNVKENVEEDIPIKKVAPGPDTEIFEIQREDLKKQLRAKSVPNIGEKLKIALTKKVSDAIGSKMEQKMSERIQKINNERRLSSKRASNDGMSERPLTNQSGRSGSRISQSRKQVGKVQGLPKPEKK